MVIMVICNSFYMPFFSSLDIYLSSKILKGLKTSNCACGCYGDDVTEAKIKWMKLDHPYSSFFG